MSDTDGDGKTDGEEGIIDTDGDGVIDALESSILDSDGDGVSDERDIGNNDYYSDSDGDGYKDWEESEDQIRTGWLDMIDPLDKSKFPPIDSDGDFLCEFHDEDDDNDGIEDHLDECPNTPEGVTVNSFGCTVVQIDPSSISVGSISSSCSNTNDGIISLSVADKEFNYLVIISGYESHISLNSINGYDKNVTGLAPGEYQVCFRVEENDLFEQCYTVVIDRPTPLQLSTQLIEDSNQLKLTLQGSTQYTIELNGVANTHDNSSTTLSLKTGLNRIRIYTDKSCQGVIEREFFISEQLNYAPNPVVRSMQLYIGGTDREVTLTLSNLSGGVLFTQTVSVPASRIYSIDLGRYSQGTYILKAQGPTVNKTIKVIKR